MKLIAKKEKPVNADCLSIEIPMYHVTVHCFTPKQNKVLEDKHGWDPCRDAQARNYIDTSREIIVRFRYDTQGTVAHEMLHAVQFIMEAIGHTPDPDGDEPSAYLLGYLVDEYYRLKKLKKKK